METLIEMIANNGIAIVCVAYLIYFQSTTMKDMNKTLSTMTMTLQSINDRLNTIEGKLK